MKKIVRNIKLFALAAAAGLGFTACDNEDYLEITAVAPVDTLVFTNTLETEYLISSQTNANVAERFVWSTPDFGAPTPVQYALEGSVNADFSTEDYNSGAVSENNQAVKVKDLMAMAEALGLDSDPTTSGPDGEPNNTGEVYFRVKAFVGDEGAVNGVNTISEIAAMTITMIEETGAGSGISIASWGVVGSAANNWGAYPDLPMYDDGSGVLFGYVYLNAGEMKFRENNDWGNNLGDTGADGITDPDGDNIAIAEAGRYKVTLDTNSGAYTIEPFTIGVVGSAYNDWGGAGPDAPLYYDYTTDTFKAGVQLMEGEMKLRVNNDWAVNYGADAEGNITEDNIPVAAGHYLITLDLNNNTIAVAETTTYGVVGSAFNDWGGAGPDAALTEIQPGIFYADGVMLLDGEMKFRVNNDWGVNYGDTGVDGILDLDGDNIATTAGTYRVMVDFTDSSAPTYTLYGFE
ncbi:SusF/SusE family outer membrane protein [Robertkochia sediminum]|uniref:SusF/SusE family outer membrane protein n=1 Tax=Robertkochia sediminum TaxID=2785326 RepID=UPI00193137DE|nr:SusF/SusE family outer membrane protein [Robertkochia sediminum]MBL7474019.1 SusF/SusE family outer membrane protein [Robertkochia sediminum]